jgi:hypothetical protein
MTAGEPPRTWMLLGAPGEGDESAAGAPVAVPEVFRAAFESRRDATAD